MFLLFFVKKVPATLGTYFIVLTVFQTVVKSVAVILVVLIRREIVAFVKDPRFRSTLTRQNGLGFLPDFLAPAPSGETMLPPSTPVKQQSGSRRKPSKHSVGSDFGASPESGGLPSPGPPPLSPGTSYQSFN